jgi:hypothetical protein
LEEERKFDKNAIKETIKKQLEMDNKYEGGTAVLKSFFHHPKHEVISKIDAVKTESYIRQEDLLQREF